MSAHRHTLGWALLIIWLAALPATAQQQDITDRPYVDAANLPAGFQVHREQEWALIRTRVVNPTEQVQTPLVAVHVEPRTQIEFARRVWLPPHSQRVVSTPIYPFQLMGGAGSNQIGAPIGVRLIDERTQRYWRAQPALLPVRDDRLPTVHFGEPEEDEAQRNVVRALRLSGGLNNVVQSVNAATVPSQPVAWDAVDVISISEDAPELDAAQRDALRRWLVQGGRLWIMLDQVDLDWPEQVLGESWNVAVGDRVGLHDFTLEWAEGSQQIESRAGIEMVRLFPPENMEVVHRVHGYPAAMRRSVGQGTLLVTTLGAEAWLNPEDGSATEALTQLQPVFQGSRATGDDDAALAEAFRPFVTDQIGYSILDRGSVATVLAVFVVILVVAGMFLAWRGRLEVIGVVGMVTAVAAAGILYLLGMSHHGDLPMSISEVQLAHTSSDQSYVRTESTAGVFLPPSVDGDDVVLRGTRGVMWPSNLDQVGHAFRLVWTDLDRWEIPNAGLGPRTVHTFSGEHTQVIAEPVHATLRFTERGMAVQVQPGPYTDWQDGVIATAQGRMALQRAGGGDAEGDGTRFMVLPAELGQGEFFAGGTLSTQQQRRQSIYRAIGSSRGFSSKPSLMAWATGGTSGLDLTGEPVRHSESLLAMPLRIERPEPGTRITVPAALMDINPARSGDVPDEYRATSFYSESDEAWDGPLRFRATAVVRYELPPGLGNLDPERVTITADLRAPGWQYEILARRGGNVEVVDRGVGPMGRVSVELTGEDVPEITEDGALLIGLRIAPPGGASPNNTQEWSLQWMGVSVTGTVRESSPEE